MKPRNIKQLQEDSRDLTVVALNPNQLVVESASDPLNSHTVDVKFLPNDEVRTRCTCEWAQYHGVACRHTMAALEHLAAHKGRTLSFWLDETDARRQKRRTFRLVGEQAPSERVWITSRRAS
ncbi:MAG: SWIM zinc finger family protein [Chloroflexota bacterium]